MLSWRQSVLKIISDLKFISGLPRCPRLARPSSPLRKTSRPRRGGNKNIQMSLSPLLPSKVPPGDFADCQGFARPVTKSFNTK